MSEARQGGCRCGAVRFEVAGPPLLTLACHCTGCQHMTASAFSLSEGYGASSFKIVQGDTVIGGIHGASRHHHCDYCKSWLFTEPEGVEGYLNIRSTTFDQPLGDKPYVEVFVSEALPWATIGSKHAYDRLPDLDKWPELINEYVTLRSGSETGLQGTTS
jgi:hypothetical protein